jgi:hypothetical protein
MQDNNTRWPGQRFENTAAATPTIEEALPGIPGQPIPGEKPKGAAAPRKQYRRDDYEQEPKDDYDAPRRKRRATGSRHRATSSQERTQPAPPPPAWGWLFKPAGGGRRARAIPPGERIVLGLGALLLWACSAFLTNLFLRSLFPVFNQSSDLNLGTLVAGVIISLIFMAVELFMWVGQHEFSVGLLVLVLMGLDVWMNIVGMMQLLGVEHFQLTNISGFIILVVGTTLALLPEKLMAVAWRD